MWHCGTDIDQQLTFLFTPNGRTCSWNSTDLLQPMRSEAGAVRTLCPDSLCSLFGNIKRDPFCTSVLLLLFLSNVSIVIIHPFIHSFSVKLHFVEGRWVCTKCLIRNIHKCTHAQLKQPHTTCVKLALYKVR
jgi:hypothetical protein